MVGVETEAVLRQRRHEELERNDRFLSLFEKMIDQLLSMVSE
jgi:hypothetical protein